ncbi:alpha/beta hydrolase fold [Pseudomonas synxantha]|uniref:Esterase/lipase/thioesterase family protein n=2 Tax=Pseudomonas synxantha TaxID=47883 RepID=A0AAX3I9F6_9PSED|nr:alpha/beta hydrolase fold [Pseudomonas synxantha]VTR02255.1 esterase/lipase/thioesterase family protein [Pseudomonas synxantha]
MIGLPVVCCPALTYASQFSTSTAFSTQGIGVASKVQLTVQEVSSPRTFTHGVTRLTDIVYATPDGHRPLTLDLYLPQRPVGHRPLIVYVHGGGWSSGHSRVAGAFEDFPAVLARFAAQGYVVASLNYRLSAEAAFPSALEDVRTAVEWLQERHRDYGVDPSRMAIWGSSAGSQLAALAALDCNHSANRTAPCAKVLISWFGIFDFSTLVKDLRFAAIIQASRRYLHCPDGPCAAATLNAASPINHIGKSAPSVLLIHGMADQVVPSQQSEAMAQALQRQGVQATLLLLPDVSHSFVGKDQIATRAANYAALEATAQFLGEHL